MPQQSSFNQPPNPNAGPNDGFGPGPIAFPEFDDTIAKEQLALSQEQFAYTKQQEALKQSNIASALKGVTGIFDKRQPIYDKLKNDSMALNMENLYNVKQEAAQDLNFAMARSGNVGGSVAADKNADLAEKMGLAVGGVEQFAQGQSDALRAQDSQLRASLQSLATTGAVGGQTASNMAGNALSGLNGVAQYAPGLENSFQGLSSGIGAANTALPQVGSASTPTTVFQQQSPQQQQPLGGF